MIACSLQDLDGRGSHFEYFASRMNMLDESRFNLVSYSIGSTVGELSRWEWLGASIKTPAGIL